MSRRPNTRACALPLAAMAEALRLAKEDGETVRQIVVMLPATAHGDRPAELEGVPIHYEIPRGVFTSTATFFLEVKA